MNNIKNQFFNLFNDNENILSGYGPEKTIEFKELAKIFVRSSFYKESKKSSEKIIINFLLKNHYKQTDGPPILEHMNYFELEEQYNYRKQRLHYTHQINVFLIGLFLYHNCSLIKNKIDQEMENTSEKFSGGSPQTEFEYSWILASLFHDIGYGIALSKDENQRNQYVQDLSKPFIKKLNYFEEIWQFSDGTDLFEEVRCSIDFLCLKKYTDFTKENPKYGPYDHGITSSVIFLHAMYDEFKRNTNNRNIDSQPYILKEAILQVAKAIALHNIDLYPMALGFSLKTTNIKIFDIDKNTFDWLLKLSDIFQEWDKPIVKNLTDNYNLEDTNIVIIVDNNNIILKNYKDKKKKEIKATIDNYVNHNNLISFSC
jgi:hypothetical protein